jgi:Flp pilus assembly protein TadG
MYLRQTRRAVRPAATLVETAVVLIPCCLLMFAVFEYGRVVMMLQVLNNAAREGARQAVITPTSYIPPATATANVQATVSAFLANQDLKNVSTQIFQADASGNNIGPWTSAPFGHNIVVQIDADFPLVFPTFGFLPNNGAAPNSMHMTARAMMRGEAN